MTSTISRPDVDYKALTECSSDVVMQVSPDNELVYVSPAVMDVLGWSQSEMLDRHQDLLFEGDRERILENAAALQSGLRQSSLSTFRVYKKDGTLLWVEGAAHKIVNAQGQPNGLVLSMRDISIRMRLREELEALARTDGLTGLANRRSFDEALAREWAIARREKTHLSLVMIDIDNFKEVNDSCGHLAGDDCLKAIAKVLVSTARRPADLVARYGGEELALILPRTPEEGAKTIGEYIRIAVEDLRIPVGNSPEQRNVLTVSIGAATVLCQDAGTAATQESLIAAANQALYKAKSTGRNKVDFTMLLITDPRA